MKKQSVAFIGAGQAASALALALKIKGYHISGVSSKGGESAERLAGLVGTALYGTDNVKVVQGATVVFIAVSDDEIASVADELGKSGNEWNGSIVGHLSGVLTSDILDPLRKKGASVMSFHPAQSLTGLTDPESAFGGIVFGMEGDPEALAFGEEVAHNLGSKTAIISPQGKALYHIANVAASNYLVTLLGEAVRILEKTGVETERALELLLPLSNGTLRNIRELGIDKALTGPISRGDIETIEKHMEALSAALPGSMDIYCELGQKTVEIAQKKGSIGEKTADELNHLLNPDKYFNR